MDSRLGMSIMEHFSCVTDPRILLKTSHKLNEIITITLCAVIAGADDWVEVADFGKAKEEWLRTFMELPGGIPSHDTFGRVFSLINPREFEKSFAQWIQSFAHKPGTVAIDGKTLRRSHDHAHALSAIHMVNAWAVEHGLVLGQVKAQEKSNEIKAIPELLKVLDLQGCTVTIDAMGCQKEIVREIVKQGAEYVISLKGNQGSLHKDVELFYEKAREEGYHGMPHETMVTVNGDHGRVETRRYTIISDTTWFPEHSKWHGLKCFGMVESERQIGNETAHETRYYISSLSDGIKGFAEAVRAHWSVENSLHWCLDIAFREDDSRVRLGHASENLAILRRFALSLIKQDRLRKSGVKASRKRAGWDNDYLQHLLSL